MMRTLCVFLGVAAGVILGSLVPNPLAAVFTPTTVTWEATTCAAGLYTITSTARATSGGATYTTTSTVVRLPRGTVVQEFPDLPPGQYAVTATVRRLGGQAFEAAQMLSVGLGATPPIYLGGRRRSTGAPTGRARPRNGEAGTPPRDPRSGLAAAPGAAPTVSPVAASRPAPVRPSLMSGSTRRPIEHMELDDVLALDLIWRQFDVLDTDGDGLVDLIRAELPTGEVWIWRISR